MLVATIFLKKGIFYFGILFRLTVFVSATGELYQ